MDRESLFEYLYISMNRLNLRPFPELKTKRLILRKLDLTDKKSIFSLRSDAKVNHFLDRPIATSHNDAIKFINNVNKLISKNECIYWAITIKGDNQLVGTICYWNISENNASAEVGFELLPAFQGKGLMSEALTAVLEYGLDKLRFQSIKGFVNPGNQDSIHLLKKSGFIEEGKFEDHLTFKINNTRLVR